MSATMHVGFALPATKAVKAPHAAMPVERGSNARLGLLLLTLSGTVSVTGLWWLGSTVVHLFT